MKLEQLSDETGYSVEYLWQTALRLRRRLSGMEDPDSCWLWQGAKHSFGYGVIGIWHDTITTHRLAFGLENGWLPEKPLVIRHTCDVPECCNPRHLLYGTQADNISDMDVRNRRRVGDHSGQRNGSAKLTNEQIAFIRANHKARHPTRSASALARRFGVTSQTVHNVVHGHTWKKTGF